MLGDVFTSRTKEGTSYHYKGHFGRAKVFGKAETSDEIAVTSVFSPRLAINMLRLYAPKTGVVFDPFAGHVRALLAAKMGLKFVGTEIRKEEVASIRKLCKHYGVADMVNIIHGDCRDTGLDDESCDFLYTCPPYWTLEQYDGGPDDISMLTNYDAFLKAMDACVVEAKRILKPGAVTCWVVGLHRHKDGHIAPFNHDLSRILSAHGFYFREEVIVYRKNPLTAFRAGHFSKGKHLLTREHEYCLVFNRV